MIRAGEICFFQSLIPKKLKFQHRICHSTQVLHHRLYGVGLPPEPCCNIQLKESDLVVTVEVKIECGLSGGLMKNDYSAGIDIY